MLTFDSPVIFWLIVFSFSILGQIFNLTRFKKDRLVQALLYLIINGVNVVLIYGLSLLCQNNLHEWAWTIIVLKIVLAFCAVASISLHMRHQIKLHHTK